MKKLLATVLALVMVISMIPTAFAAETAAYTSGLVVEKATEENLAGKFGKAYEATGYQATLLM